MPEGSDNDIAARLNRLEERVDRITAYLSQSSPAPAPPPRARPEEPAPRARPVDAEGFFGGRVLLAVGAATLLLGVGFFIKYAFDNGWIGPSGRVAMGLLAGVAAIAIGDRMHAKGKAHYAAVLVGLGGGILYLSLWGASQIFHLIAIPISFFAMGVVTAALVTLSVRRDSEVTAAFAMLGGFITPLLNATDSPAPLNLLIYISILNAMLAFLPINRRWPRVQSVAFLFTQAYLLVAVIGGGSLDYRVAIAFATLFLALFAWQPIRKAFAGIALSGYESVLSILSVAAYYVALHGELFQHHRNALTAAIVVLAALFVAVARNATSRDRGLLAAVALALITGGVAVTFTGATLTALWGIEGALLCWAGLRGELLVARIFGFLSLGLAVAMLEVSTPTQAHPFVNAHFASYAIVALSFLAARWAYARSQRTLSNLERAIFLALEPIGHAIALVALSNDLYVATAHGELAITLLWAAYAIALFGYGALRKSAFARWEGLALISLALLKAFFVDMEAVNPGVRIVSFLALGILLLGIAYAYQRFAGGAKEAL